jgi:hypothetical protein
MKKKKGSREEGHTITRAKIALICKLAKAARTQANEAFGPTVREVSFVASKEGLGLSGRQCRRVRAWGLVCKRDATPRRSRNRQAAA